MRVTRKRRRGSVLPLVVLGLVAMCGFVALAVDVGLIAVAKTQCQLAADAGAMAGARSLDGTVGQNIGSPTTLAPKTAWDYAVDTAQANKVLTNTPSYIANDPTSQVQVVFGSYHYDQPSKSFVPLFNNPPVYPDNYNLCQVSVSWNVQTTFAPVFNIINPSFNSVIPVSATSQAVHRPRDVAIILDYSGSMNNESDLWNAESYLGSANQTSNNIEAVYPLFGPYNGPVGAGTELNYSNYTNYPNLLSPAASSAPSNSLSGNPLIGKSNVSYAVLGLPAMVNDFFQNAFGMAPVYAFSKTDGSPPVPDSQNYNLVPGGDNYLVKYNNSAATMPSKSSKVYPTYAQNVAEVTGQSSTPTSSALPTTYASAVYAWEKYGYDAVQAVPSPDNSLGKVYNPNYNSSNSPAKFNGYSMGPRYWGKTFFVWPPDPRWTQGADPTNLPTAFAAPPKDAAGKMICDWRQRFFFKSDGVTPCNDNTLLFNTGGNVLKDPPGNYVINYKAILAWIKQVTPDEQSGGGAGQTVFPAVLRSGHVLYYDQIPSDVPASAYDHTQPNYNITDPSQRLWKEYIDYVLGVWRDPAGNIQHPPASACSIGGGFTFGTTQLKSPPAGSVTFTVPGLGSKTVTPAMDYKDNPPRPRHTFWFGPMTMVQYLSDTTKFSGVTHDISMYPMKSGVGAALTDIQNNHPNDQVSMILFNRPQYDDDPPETGSFNRPQYNLTNNYGAMLTSLWLPPNSSTSDVRLWDVNGLATPRAYGDWTSNTASSFGFMLAFNQFSTAPALLTPPDGGTGVGGLGRKGATKLVIYETDGMANQGSTPGQGFQNNGGYLSYYHIMPGEKVYGKQTSNINNEIYSVVEAMCNQDDGTPYNGGANIPSGCPTPPSYPGYATVNKPVLVHCIAFGAIFETPNSSQSAAVPLLQNISSIGSTVFPSSATDPQYGYKWCIGTISQRQTKLTQAFLSILDSSVPVSLIK